MKYVLSTIAGVESIAKKEITRQGGKIQEVTDRLITFTGPSELIPRINLWSRVGNKMYLLLEDKEEVTDFDSLFDVVNSISWKKYFKKDFPIVVKSSSIRSDLYSPRTIQSIGKKAIVKNLVGDDAVLNEDENLEKLEILILIIDNRVRILLDTSGDALHMRGYRTRAGEAPIKESLAASLVLLSGWKFQESFYDPFCGSGTVAIEALMIAKNIAPGLKRSFAFEKLGLVDSETTQNERLQAKKKEFNGDYRIIASDIDEEMVDLAQENASRAGLAGEINFEVKDFITSPPAPLLQGEGRGTLVSNPPYGDRLKDENIKSLYNNIDKLFRINTDLSGGIISSYLEFDELIKKGDYKKRKLYNGGEKCYFWRKNKKN